MFFVTSVAAEDVQSVAAIGENVLGVAGVLGDRDLGVDAPPLFTACARSEDSSQTQRPEREPPGTQVAGRSDSELFSQMGIGRTIAGGAANVDRRWKHCRGSWPI
jgi:hypothetical protein